MKPRAAVQEAARLDEIGRYLTVFDGPVADDRGLVAALRALTVRNHHPAQHVEAAPRA
jgi:hypothetical protein